MLSLCLDCRDGIAMTLGFFDDVFVPGDVLTEEYQFKSEENVWVWNHPDKDIGELFIDAQEPCRWACSLEQ